MIKNINKTAIILAMGMFALIFSANFVFANDEPPSLELPAGFFQEESSQNPPSLALPTEFSEDQNNPPVLAIACIDGYTLVGNQCVQNSQSGNSGSNSGSYSGSGSNSQGMLKISEASNFPVGFNPQTSETVISYKLSGTGLITVTIVDKAGVLVATLAENKSTTGNTVNNISWNGLSDKTKTIVSPGKYFFKLTLKTSQNGSIVDTKTGEINVIYGTDFELEGAGLGTLGSTKGTAGSISAMHNSPPKETSGTGPATMIYLTLPILGYLGSRFIIRKK
ncbi:MAG: hypothetical protein PHP74_04915 [Candidatus Gracilibacteria bacterium]|nr:hypothetical protein [Candidatus Gracilibacteria bacterium]